MQSRAIILALLLLASSVFADSKTFSNSTDIKDTYIYDGDSDDHSSDTILLVANAYGAHHANALFTLESSAWDSIGMDQVITACSVYAYCYDRTFNNTTNSAFLKRPVVMSEATYALYSTGNSWQTAGAQGANDKGSNYDVETIDADGLYKFALDTTELNDAYRGDSTYRGMLQRGWSNLMVCFNSVDAAADHRFAIILYYEAISAAPVNYRHGPDGVGQRHGPDGVSARSSP